jgi:hypothetical protein
MIVQLVLSFGPGAHDLCIRGQALSVEYAGHLSSSSTVTNHCPSFTWIDLVHAHCDHAALEQGVGQTCAVANMSIPQLF